MQLSIQTAAETRLTDLLSSGLKTRIHSFKAAGTSGVTPNKNSGTPSGTVTYTGTASQIKYTKVSQHEVVFVIYLDHDVGGFNIGNVMVFLEPAVVGGQPIPFLWASLISTTNKNTSNLESYVIGNRIMIHCTVWFPYLTNVIDLNQHEELVVRLDNYASDKHIPAVDASEYPQLVIDRHSAYDAATLVIKDTERSLWWGMALTQYINDPDIGKITGGIVGQPYGSPSDTIYYDAREYKIDNAGFETIDGGANWITANETPLNGGAY